MPKFETQTSVMEACESWRQNEKSHTQNWRAEQLKVLFKTIFSDSTHINAGSSSSYLAKKTEKVSTFLL